MKFKFCIISAGGMACSYVHEVFDKFKITKNMESDRDALKHLYSPRSEIFKNHYFEKVIYIYNDPLLSIISHFRREWAYTQHKKILAPSEHMDESIFKDMDYFFKLTAIYGKDLFGIEKHFFKWFENLDHSKNLYIDFRDPCISEKLSKYSELDIKIKIAQRSSEYYLSSIDDKIINIYKLLDEKIIKLINLSQSNLFGESK